MHVPTEMKDRNERIREIVSLVKRKTETYKRSRQLKTDEEYSEIKKGLKMELRGLKEAIKCL